MAISNEELLRKAVLVTSDFGGAGEAPLSVEQIKQFIVLLSAPQVMLADVRRVTSAAAKWQESILDFGSRITYPGQEATRLSAGQRAVPSLGVVEISTVLLRAEVPVSDEVMEDNVAGEGLADDLETSIASRVGFDIEDLMLNGDTGSADPYLALADGWLVQAQGPQGHVVDATDNGQDYQQILRSLLNNLPDRFKRNIEVDGRYYVPKRLEEKYRDILASRGTPYGDVVLQEGRGLTYQGIDIVGVPSMAIDSGSPDTSNILLTNRNNLYAGFRRAMTFETFRDPREGATSFIVTARVEGKVAVPDATAIAVNVDVTI